MSGSAPHDRTYVRLGKSDIHGIGVFACRGIDQGTNVFAADQREITWVTATVLDDPQLADFERSFYQDFAIRRGDELGCPSNFNLLTVGWYVNEPRAGDEPNLVPSPRFDLIALRYIAPGEELTVCYSSYETQAQEHQANREETAPRSRS